MPKNLIKQYIKQRELVDPEFAKDFEDGLREFKKNKDQKTVDGAGTA